MTESPAIGVVLAQIGTPEEATPEAFEPYLEQFLADDRVIDSPRWWWLPLLKHVIAPRRAREMAEQYEGIWAHVGAPLLTISRQQADGLQERLGAGYKVALGMTYAGPSIAHAVRDIEAAGIRRIVILPMFPQYSTTTTAAIYDEVMLHALGRTRTNDAPEKKFVPALRCIPPFYEDPRYIDVLARNIEQQYARLDSEPDRIIVSFHGIPVSYVEEGDPYQAQVERTFVLLKDALGWTDDDRVVLRYQSRFGKAEWLQPYTADELKTLHENGYRRPVIIAPGFTTDNMETLYELDIEARELITESGGDPSGLSLFECLNADSAWLDYLAELIRGNAQGW